MEVKRCWAGKFSRRGRSLVGQPKSANGDGGLAQDMAGAKASRQNSPGCILDERSASGAADRRHLPAPGAD
jgi:hypothetical protein